MFLAVALATGSLGALAGLSGPAIGLLAAAGVLHFVIGRYGNFRAAKAIGNNLSAPVIQLGLAVALGLAILVMHETLTPLRILGIALLAIGPAVMRNGGADAPAEDAKLPEVTPAKFQPRYAEGYAFSLLAALCYGVTPVMIRAAVASGDL